MTPVEGLDPQVENCCSNIFPLLKTKTEFASQCWLVLSVSLIKLRTHGKGVLMRNYLHKIGLRVWGDHLDSQSV